MSESTSSSVQYDYQDRGDHNYEGDKAHAEHMKTNGRMTVKDYQYAGYHDAENLVARDSEILSRFYP